MKSKLLIASILLQFCLTAMSTISAQENKFLADRHQSKSIVCSACHGKEAPNNDLVLIGKNCQVCHGSYQQLIERVKEKYPEVNPHDQHDGDLSCAVCHRGHQKGVNYCEECHGTFVFEVP